MNKENLTLTEYDIKGVLGKGTFSKVKLGINKITREKVAIKIIDKQLFLNKNNYIRIKREIYILKKASHPNIIKVFDIKEDIKNYYIIMEYCKYGELFKHIINQKNLDPNFASFYFFQLINGLKYLHLSQIIHRDLKPENILIGDNKILKIIDFGLSNFSSQDEYLSTPCGSPSYAPPEMIVGNKYNGMSGDIWSCGVILYVMLCGYLPFDGKNNNDLFNKIVKCKVNYPKNLDKNAVDLLKNILVSNPNKRINLETIKKHQFYLKGKKIFQDKFPDLIDKIENENNINCIIITKEIRNLFGKNNNEIENSNKLINNIRNNRNNIKVNEFKSFENQKNYQKENQEINNLVYKNKNNKHIEVKKESNFYKSNLLIRTKNINYYKKILSDRLNIHKIKNPKNYSTQKNKENFDDCKNLKNFSSMSKSKKTKYIIETNKTKRCNTISKNESTNDTKTIDTKENYKERKISKHRYKSPNFLIVKHYDNNDKFHEEEKNATNEINKTQKDTKKFNDNNSIKNLKKIKKIYKNEISNFSGDNIKCEEENICVNRINSSLNPIKKMLSSYNINKRKKQFEEINQKNFDDKYKNIKSNKEIKERLTMNKCKNLSIHPPQEIINKKDKQFLTEKNIRKKININKKSLNKLCNSQKKYNLKSNNKISKGNVINKNDKNNNLNDNKYKLVNKLNELSSIKKNFNTCNDILNSSKGKEEFKKYIISHNKMSKAKLSNPNKFINNISLKKTLNYSEKKIKHISKNNSNILDESETSINERRTTYKSNNKKLLNNNKSLNKSKILNHNSKLNKFNHKNIAKTKSGNNIYNERYRKSKE